MMTGGLMFVLGLFAGGMVVAVVMAAVQIGAAHDAFMEADELTKRAKADKDWWRHG